MVVYTQIDQCFNKSLYYNIYFIIHLEFRYSLDSEFTGKIILS